MRVDPRRDSDDLDELDETRAVLGNQELLADLREADAAYAAGDVVRGVEAALACLRERAG